CRLGRLSRGGEIALAELHARRQRLGGGVTFREVLHAIDGSVDQLFVVGRRSEPRQLNQKRRPVSTSNRLRQQLFELIVFVEHGLDELDQTRHLSERWRQVLGL